MSSRSSSTKDVFDNWVSVISTIWVACSSCTTMHGINLPLFRTDFTLRRITIMTFDSSVERKTFSIKVSGHWRVGKTDGSTLSIVWFSQSSNPRSSSDQATSWRPSGNTGSGLLPIPLGYRFDSTDRHHGWTTHERRLASPSLAFTRSSIDISTEKTRSRLNKRLRLFKFISFLWVFNQTVVDRKTYSMRTQKKKKSSTCHLLQTSVESKESLHLHTRCFESNSQQRRGALEERDREHRMKWNSNKPMYTC